MCASCLDELNVLGKVFHLFKSRPKDLYSGNLFKGIHFGSEVLACAQVTDAEAEGQRDGRLQRPCLGTSETNATSKTRTRSGSKSDTFGVVRRISVDANSVCFVAKTASFSLR